MPKNTNETIDVGGMIQESEVMAYSWYHRKDLIRHTGLVISFDGSQTLTLDYGPDGSEVKNRIKIALATLSVQIAATSSVTGKKKANTEKFAVTVKLNGLVDLNYFTGMDIKIKGTLLNCRFGRRKRKKTL